MSKEKSELFSEKSIDNFWLSIELSKEYRQKNLEAKLLFIGLFKVFDSIERVKMEQITLVYGLYKTIRDINILPKNTKAIVRSSDGGIEVFNIVGGVLQEDTLAPYMPKWRKENGFQKDQKQKISIRNYDRRRLHRWPSASRKYTSPSLIPVA